MGASYGPSPNGSMPDLAVIGAGSAGFAAAIRGAELGASLGTAVSTAQPLAVQQVRAAKVGPVVGAGEPLDGLAIEPVGGLAVAEQRA